MYVLLVYGARQSDVIAVWHFLTGCYERRYTIDRVNIFNLLKHCDQILFSNIKGDSCHPLYHIAPKAKVTSYQ